MLRKNYDSELAELNENVTRMGKLSEEAILSALKAVKGEDDNAKEHVDALAVEFDSKKREVENTCIRLILTQQPVASDLRFISAALKFATDLHRIGISSADIVDCVSGRKGVEIPNIVAEANEAAEMVSDSIKAFVEHNVDLARSVIARDDKVDALYQNAKASIINMITENPSNGSSALELMNVAKYLERIGDHVCNIAEWVIFAETGIHEDIPHGKGVKKTV